MDSLDEEREDERLRFRFLTLHPLLIPLWILIRHVRPLRWGALLFFSSNDHSQKVINHHSKRKKSFYHKSRQASIVLWVPSIKLSFFHAFLIIITKVAWMYRVFGGTRKKTSHFIFELSRLWFNFITLFKELYGSVQNVQPSTTLGLILEKKLVYLVLF